VWCCVTYLLTYGAHIYRIGTIHDNVKDKQICADGLRVVIDRHHESWIEGEGLMRLVE
jgi:hypothetical protein